MFAKEKRNTIMKKEKKQLRELSEDDLKKVTGGGYIQLIDFDNMQLRDNPGLPQNIGNDLCPNGQVASTDENGNFVCVPEA